MKKLNLIKRLWTDSHEKQSPQRFARYAAMLIMLLTLGVGQMWAGQNINAAYLKASFNGSAVLWDGSSDEYVYSGSDHDTYDLGTLTGDFIITYVSWRAYADWDNTTDFYLYYRTNGGSFSNNIKQNWTKNGGLNDYYPKTTDLSHTVASVTDGSGNYDFDHYFYANFGGYGGDNESWLSNGGGNYHFTYKILPPAVSSFSVSESNHLSGSGTSADPYIMPYNGTLSLSISGSKEHTDANSSAQYYNTSSSDAWSATATKSIANITSTTKTSVTVKMRYYNSTAKLAGSESTKTIYYQSEASYGVTAAKTPSAGGSVTPTSATTMGTTSGGNITATPNTGYNFTSWAITSGSGYFGSTGTATTSTTANTKFRPSAASTVTATFTAKTYSITLDDDGEYDGNGSATATYNGTALSISSHARRDGWNLVGYFAAGTGDQVTDASGNLLPSKSFSDGSSHAITNSSSQWIYDGDLTLYAHWSKEYSVTYNANGGSGTMTDANSPYEAGSNVTVLTNTFTRSGYTFTGWNTDSGGEGSSYANGATISSIAANVTLYAQWSENNYTVTVNAGSHGSVASGSVTGHKDTKVTLPTATANTGYHFSTWTTTTGSVTYTNQTSATSAQVNGLTAAATVRADFAANTYSVVFNANGGTGSMSNEAFTYDAAAKALTSNAFTRSGYTFLGWATTAEKANALTVDYTNGQSVRNLTSTHNGTFNLYAVWAKKYYIGGRFQHDWEDGTATTNEMTYDATTGYYKFTTSKTVNELSVQWYNSSSYYADQYFYIHTGLGKGASSSQPTYVGASGNGHDMEVKLGYSNAYVLTSKTSSFSSFADDDLLKFSNTDNLSSNVIVWWDPANRKVWYTATESLNTNYYLLGFGEGSWDETDARRFKVAAVNATTATVSVSLSAKTYETNTDDGFKVEKGGTYYGNNGTMTRANCTGWEFETDKNNCGITADMADTYTFTLNLSTMAVSVTYPTEAMHTVTVEADGSGGSITAPAAPATTVSAGISTPSSTITATPTNEAWRFHYWTIPDGVTIASGSTTSASITINATADSKTITAHFQPRFALVGSLDETGNPAGGMPADGSGNTWDNNDAADFTVEGFTALGSGDGKGVDLRCSRTLLANRRYKFRVLDRSLWQTRGCTSDDILGADANWQLNSTGDGSHDVHINTVGAGTYTFKITNLSNDGNLYPSITVLRQASYSVTFGYGTGGSEVTASGSTSESISSGGYVASGEDVTFTQTPATGYTFKGWYDASSGGTAISSMASDNVYDDIAADISVYAQYTENMTTVALTDNGHGHVEIGGATVTSTTAGVATTRSITAVPDAGYYFSGWEVVSGSDFSVAGTGEANATTTLTGGGAGEESGQTLKANFTELEKIYFRNEFKDGETVTTWSDVYVYFHITWVSTNQVHSSSTASHIVHMTQITGTNVWWAYVPRDVTYNNYANVAFSNHQFSTNTTFSGYKAACRGDYNRLLNMFVPHHTKKETANSTDYYSNGYWMKYDTRANQGAGYYLKKFDSKGNYSIDSVFRATNDDATFIQCRLRIDDPTATLKYMITSAGGLNYIADEAITTANCTGVGVSENLDDIAEKEVYFSLTTSSEGFYTFVLDQSGDKMKLNVIYPVSVGDYKLVHEYNDGSAKTSHSDIIKAADASGTTVSMYLNMDAATKSLKLYKCTAITEGVPTWGSNTTVGTGDGLFNTTTFNKGKGVYVFDVAITSNAVSSISNAGLYEGNYYIKTDCAPGGWANYKQNILKENTVNASDYDYYMCKWIGNTTTNVKCVIANDYNNEISDTLKSDAILTRSEIAYQTLPEAGSVRFSYNSATNELKRTYLLGGTTQVKIEPLDDYVYGSSSGSDEYTTSTNFTDCGNWMYRLEAYVYPGAKAGIYTNYPTSSPTKEQLVPTTFTLMGGESKGSTRYNVQLIYDFQTNELVSAYIANGEVSSAIDLNSNFLYVRNGTGASTQLSFSDGGKLTNVKHAYGVFEFPKNEMSGQMDSWTANSNRAYERCRYYFSFPFDVRVSDIFGVGEFGTHYIIQKYNGAKRAKHGWFMEYNTFWETVNITDTLNANEGYCLMLDRKAFNSTASDGVWTNIGSGQSTYLYFPSMNGSLGTINAASGTYDIDSLSCKINRSWTTASGTKNHMTTDSNWRMIGMPAYANAYSDGGTNPFTSCYKYDPSDNSWKTYAVGSKAGALQSMHAYMIQWAGKFAWTTTAPTPVAARQPQSTTNMLITLNLMKDGTARDWTYVKLQDGADSDFVLNEDMCKVVNGGIPNIYTFAGSYDAGYNEVPATNQTIPVGVIIRADGEYTFSMPANIAGTVTLVDTNTGTRTNLALDDYTVELESGTIDDRFYLEIDLTNVVTAIDGAMGEGEGTLKDGKAHKFIQNGVMYILRDGQIYSTDGQIVK